MIANYTEKGWQIITQRSHGLLAAQICANWKKENQPGRWVETLIATAEHDDVYNEFTNDDLLNDMGGPVNFKQTGFRMDYAKRLIAMAETKSAYIASLISRHIQFVHGSDPKAKGFIRSLKAREKTWCRISKVSALEVTRAYELLEFCDAFSLLICQGLVQPEHRKIEISNGPEGKKYVMHTAEDALVVESWPFETDSFMLYWESRTLAELSFKSVEGFRTAVNGADVIVHQLEVRKSR